MSARKDPLLTLLTTTGDLQARWQTWRESTKRFTYREHSMAYHDEGEGEVLVCIHGFPTSSWDWYQIWPALVQHYRIIAIDMLGFGYSAKPRRYPYAMVDQADLHEQLLASLGVGQLHILSHNYGDSVAQELMARQKEGKLGFSIQSVCMLNGGIIPGAHRPRLMQRLLISPLGPLVGRLMNYRSFKRSFSEVFGEKTQPGEEELQLFWREIEENQGTAIMHLLIRYMTERRENYERWVGALRQDDLPLRLIFGEVDPVSGQHMVDAYRRERVNPDTVTLKGIGHYPQTEAPELVLKHFVEFQRTLAAE